MKKFFSSPAFRLVALAILFVASSSCHRGYGCPSNFSLQDTLNELLHSVFALIF